MENILQKIVAGLLTPFFFLASWSGVLPEQPVPMAQQQTLGAFYPTGGATYRLASSIGTSNTTLRLSSFKEPVSNIPYTMSYLGSSIAYGTLDPQTNHSEFVSFTGITQNSDGTATISGLTRGLSRTPGTGGCVGSTTLSQAHAGQSVFISTSDSPCFFSEYAVKRNDEFVTGSWSFPTPTIAANPATKSYVDGVQFGGIGNASETATGTVEISTQQEAASSTMNGSLGRLALPGSMSTSTYNSATAPLRIPMTMNNGFLDSGFLDLTTYNKQASTSQFTASGLTNLATTTIAYFTTLQKVFATTTTADASTSGEVTMFATNLAPSLMTGAVLKTTTIFNPFNNQDGCTGNNAFYPRLYLGSTVISSTTIQSMTDESFLQLKYTIVDTGSNSQRVSMEMATTTGGGPATAVISNGVFKFPTTTASYSINTAPPLNLKLTIQRGGNGGSCMLVADYSYAEIIR